MQVYTGGDIHTFDPARPRATALVVRGARIVAVGGDADCLAAAGPGAERVDLAGRTVIPGLTDTHIHTAFWSRSLAAVDLRHSEDYDAALGAVGAFAAGLGPGEWVQGGHWDRNRWADPVLPDRRALDAVTGGRPAWLASMDGHSAWLNTAALAAVGIDSGTPDPVGGAIDRDADGEPTGILRESATLAIGDRLNDPAVLPGQMLAAMRRLASHGITSIHDVDLDGANARAVFEDLHAADELPVRVTKLLRVAELDDAIAAGVATGDGDSWLRTGWVKVFTDGAIGSHSCLMGRDFPGEPGNRGMAVTDHDTVVDLITRANGAGIAVGAHAIGDEANRLLLDAYAAAGSRALRNRIEHAQYLRQPDIARFAELNVTAAMQPVHCTSDIALNDTLLPNTDLACYAWRSLIDAGATVVFGSDAPVEDPNPWLGVHAAVTRQRADGTPAGGWQGAERISLMEAIAAYTVTPAWSSGEELLKGRLRPGMLADFAVLAANPWAADPRDLHELTVDRTVAGGRVTHGG